MYVCMYITYMYIYMYMYMHVHVHADMGSVWYIFNYLYSSLLCKINNSCKWQCSTCGAYLLSLWDVLTEYYVLYTVKPL